MKKQYSELVAFWKWIKNTFVVVGIPALAVLGNHYTEWVPEEYQYYVAAILSLIAYRTKNKLDFEKRK